MAKPFWKTFRQTGEIFQEPNSIYLKTDGLKHRLHGLSISHQKSHSRYSFTNQLGPNYPARGLRFPQLTAAAISRAETSFFEQ